MPFINIQVSDDLYRHARLAAARRNMSVSALLRAVLVTIDQQPAEGRPDGKEFQQTFHPLPDADVYHEKGAMVSEHIEKERKSERLSLADIRAIMAIGKSYRPDAPPSPFSLEKSTNLQAAGPTPSPSFVHKSTKLQIYKTVRLKKPAYQNRYNTHKRLPHRGSNPPSARRIRVLC